MTRHIAPGCFERDPVWVPATADQVRALMGRTKPEQDAARSVYAKQMGPVKVEQRRKVA